MNNYLRRRLDPTNKLVTDLINMEGCYINTGHPDFLNGHRAMAQINDRVNQAKNPQPADPKGRSSAVVNTPSLEPEPANAGFFGSFFASKKKKSGAMEPVEPPAQCPLCRSRQLFVGSCLSSDHYISLVFLSFLATSYPEGVG